MNMVRSMGLEPSNGLITPNILVSSTITTSMEREFILGVMVEDTKVNGKITKCTEKVHSHGQMEGSMLENILMIKSKVMGNSFGLMADHIRETGIMESNMVKVSM